MKREFTLGIIPKELTKAFNRVEHKFKDNPALGFSKEENGIKSQVLNLEETTIEEFLGIANTLEAGLMGCVRHNALNGTPYKQLVACTLFYKEVEGVNKIFLYQRKSDDGNKGQLTNKVSMVVGGHVNVQDICTRDEFNDEIDLTDTVVTALGRELREEVDSFDLVKARKVFILVSDDDLNNPGYVGNVHVGAVFLAEVAPESDIAMMEDHNLGLGFLSIDEILNSELELELWGKYLVEYFKQKGW